MAVSRDELVILGGALLLFLWPRKGGAAPGTDTLPGSPTGGGPVFKPGAVGPLPGSPTGGGPVFKPGAVGPLSPNYPQIVDPWIASSPTMGKFYQVSMGDNWTSVAKRATKDTGESHVSYIRAMNLPLWNQRLYATPWDPNNPKIPEYTAANVDDGKIVISKAFLPGHENAPFLLRQGKSPQRTILNDMAGTPVKPGNSYGLLWLPSEDYPEPPVAIRQIATAVYG